MSGIIAFQSFINCTASGSTCEVNDNYLSSGSGTCDNNTNLCICPPGYDGNDIFRKWNDCHVHVDSRIAMESITTIIIATGCIFVLFSMVRSLIFWGIIYWKDDEFEMNESPTLSPRPPSPRPPSKGTLPIVVSSDTIPLNSEPSIPSSPTPKRRSTLTLPTVDMGELQSPRINARTNTFQQIVAERKRRRNTLLLLLVWLAYSFWALVFQVYVHLNHRIDQIYPLMLFSLCGVFTNAIWGLWLLTYTWFSNLPSLRTFANMFPSIRKNILVKFPNLVKYFTLFNVVLSGASSLAVFFILPIILPDAVGPFLLEIGLSVLAAQILIFTLTHLGVCFILLSLFKMLRTSRVSQSKD